MSFLHAVVLRQKWQGDSWLKITLLSWLRPPKALCRNVINSHWSSINTVCLYSAKILPPVYKAVLGSVFTQSGKTLQTLKNYKPRPWERGTIVLETWPDSAGRRSLWHQRSLNFVSNLRDGISHLKLLSVPRGVLKSKSELLPSIYLGYSHACGYAHTYA